MGKAVHRLSNLDPEAKMADCAACGRVKIIRKGNPRKVWCCSIAQREYGGAGRLRRKSGYIASPETAEQRKQANGICEICGTGGHDLFVDHDHACSKFRGLLCRQCNFGIGHFKDDPKILRAAADYLDRFAGKVALAYTGDLKSPG